MSKEDAAKRAEEAAKRAEAAAKQAQEAAKHAALSEKRAKAAESEVQHMSRAKQDKKTNKNPNGLVPREVFIIEINLIKTRCPSLA